jgi:tetratricopeptide (TPR) repeat protein
VIAQMESRAGRMPQAIAQLREAIKLDPNTAVLWIQLSQWLIRINDTAGAFTAAQKAVALEPNNAGAHMTMADLYKRQRKPAEAEPSWSGRWRSTRRRPYLALAQLHFEQRATRRPARCWAAGGRAPSHQGYYLLGRIGTERAVGRRLDQPQARGGPRRITTGPGPRSASSTRPRTRNRRRGRVYKGSAQANPTTAFVERLGDLLVKLGATARPRARSSPW